MLDDPFIVGNGDNDKSADINLVMLLRHHQLALSCRNRQPSQFLSSR